MVVFLALPTSQRIALLNPVAFADPQRPVPEVRQDDEQARVELDDDDVPRSVHGFGHEAGALRIVNVVARDDHPAVHGRPEGLLPAIDGRVADPVAEMRPFSNRTRSTANRWL